MKRSRGRVVHVDSLEELDRQLAAGATSLRGWRVRGVDLTGRHDALARVRVSGATFLACRFAPGDDERVRAAGRRGTQDFGLMLLRLALGVVFIAHGLQKAFGWWGGGGLDAFKTTLSEAGYEHAGVLTYVGAGAQIAAGVLLVLGLFTPLAAAVALGLLVNSALMSFDSQRRDGGLLIFGSAATEYLLTLSVVAAVVILVGPGRYGFDAGRGWARRPFIGSIAALLLGIAGGVAAWLFRHGTNPFA